MGTISSGVGLYSGLDYASLVDQLIAIDARPRDQLVSRISTINAQTTALLDISARVSALLARVNTLTKASYFQTVTATSSDPGVLSAGVVPGTQPGAYSFTVHALATTHQLVSRGFASADASVGAGQFTIESAAARVNAQTTLDELNGYTGVQRGSITIVNSTGDETTIDLRAAQTVADVVDLVNQSESGVRAELRGEGLVLTDTAGGTQGLRIREVGDGHTAADLGFQPGQTYSSTGELVGDKLVYLAATTPLDALNDGLGVRRLVAGTDFTIQSSDASVKVNVKLSEIITETTRLQRLNHGRGVELGKIRITQTTGQATEVDLTGATTIGEVKERIESAVSGVSVVMSGGKLVVTDATSGTQSDFKIEDVDGHAARDLGILATADEKRIDGSQILHVDTLGDVIAAINYGEGNRDSDGVPVIQASISADGTGLTITDHGGGTFPSTVIALPEGSSSQALEDLGLAAGVYSGWGEPIAGRRIIGGIDTVLLNTLNGGQGFTGGVVRLTANGATADVDLTGAQTLRDVIDKINATAAQAQLGIKASYDGTGTRLQLSNMVDDAGQIGVADVAGDFASAIGLEGGTGRVKSANVQRQYLNENTLLADLNQGRGVSAGTIKFTNSKGLVEELNLETAGVESLGELIAEINDFDGLELEARINDTGDGLLIIDHSGGTGQLKIEDKSGTAAAELNIAGSAESGVAQIDGAFEFSIDTSEGDTLADLAEQINRTTLASARTINDGSGAAPYRLTVSSLGTGLAGELIIDGGDLDMDFATLTAAQDARVSLGAGSDSGIMITSSQNVITDVVDGLTLTLSSVSEDPVTVTVEQDVSTLIDSLSGLVEDYNSLVARIDELSSYDAQTETKGVLFADSALRTLESRMFNALTGAVPGAVGSIKRLSEVGIQFEGGELTFDEDKFRTAYENDPTEVTKFFTTAEVGVSLQIQAELEGITETGGLLDRRESALTSQRELLETRVEQLNVLLTAKRARMLSQFIAMEQALAALESQQSALSSLIALDSSSSS